MKKRNPIAKAVTRLRPKVVPDKRKSESSDVNIFYMEKGSKDIGFTFRDKAGNIKACPPDDPCE